MLSKSRALQRVAAFAWGRVGVRVIGLGLGLGLGLHHALPAQVSVVC